jgi:hypothetical protein
VRESEVLLGGRLGVDRAPGVDQSGQAQDQEDPQGKEDGEDPDGGLEAQRFGG